MDKFNKEEEIDLVQGLDKETANAVLDFRSSLTEYQDRRRWEDFLEAVSHGFGSLMDWEESEHQLLDELPDDDYIDDYSTGNGLQGIFDDV